MRLIALLTSKKGQFYQTMVNPQHLEIERKFLVTGAGWPRDHGTHYRQGYLASSPSCTVRVRAGGGRGYVTIKGIRVGVSRTEFEFEIPDADARLLIEQFCPGNAVEKTRFLVSHQNVTWEVDVFHGANSGLIVAEVELEREDQRFEKPSWIGQEVSHDNRFANSCLANRPLRDWPVGEAAMLGIRYTPQG